MAVRKKGSRRITVGDSTFLWRYPHRPTGSQRDGEPGVTVTVQSPHGEGAPLILRFPHRFHPAGQAYGEPSRPLLPSEVARCIRQALAAGWRPDESGRAFLLTVEGA